MPYHRSSAARADSSGPPGWPTLPPVRTFEQAPPTTPAPAAPAGEIGTFSGHVAELAGFFGCVALGCVVGAPFDLGPVGSSLAFIVCVLLFELRRSDQWPPAASAAAPYLVGCSFGVGIAAVAADSALADLLIAASLTAGVAVSVAAYGWSTAADGARGVAPAAFLTSLLWPLTMFESRPLLSVLMICSAGVLIHAGFAAGRREPGAPRVAGLWVFVMYIAILGLLEG